MIAVNAFTSPHSSVSFTPFDSDCSPSGPIDTAMQKRLVDAMGEDFENRLNQRLVEHGLIGNADAERELGVQVKDEITGRSCAR